MASPEESNASPDAPVETGFTPPSIHEEEILNGASYTYHSPIPHAIAANLSEPCVLGVDEAGRGPVLGPMVYGVFYLPASQHRSLLSASYHFDDSKVLTPATRSSLVRSLCAPETDLHKSCGWATRVMSARDISAGMLKPGAVFNLNAQAMDATIQLIREVLARGVNVTHVYVDTIGSPALYQTKLERLFPALSVTVEKKADSLFPCVSAASVCAKVTRDVALDVSYRPHAGQEDSQNAASGWGSGYPSDARCVAWLKQNMDPVFGWGSECRFSWGTAKELLENQNIAVKHDWPQPDQPHDGQMSNFVVAAGEKPVIGQDVYSTWFGSSVREDVL